MIAPGRSFVFYLVRTLLPLTVALAVAAALMFIDLSGPEQLLSFAERPVHFEPCVPVQLADPPQPYIDLLVRSARHAGVRVATARHWGLGFCIIVQCEDECTALVNPAGSVAGEVHKLVAHDPLLCDEPGIVEHYPQFKLEWEAVDGTKHEARYSDEQAYRLQLALDVLHGKDICAAKV